MAMDTCSEPFFPSQDLPLPGPACGARAQPVSSCLGALAPGNICKEIAEGIERGARKRSEFFFLNIMTLMLFAVLKIEIQRTCLFPVFLELSLSCLSLQSEDPCENKPKRKGLSSKQSHTRWFWLQLQLPQAGLCPLSSMGSLGQWARGEGEGLGGCGGTCCGPSWCGSS